MENDKQIKIKDIYPLNHKRDVYASILERQGEVMSVGDISKDCGIRLTICRTVVSLLCQWGYIEKKIAIKLHDKYVRYTYVVVPGKDYLKDNYEEKDWAQQIASLEE